MMTHREREGKKLAARKLAARLVPVRSPYDGIRYRVDRPELRARLAVLMAELEADYKARQYR